jgi:hypothetical protein
MKPMNCPNCGAALPPAAARLEIAVCEFCGTSFRVPKSLTPEPDMGDLLLGADFSGKVMPGWEVLNEDKVAFHKGSPPEMRGTFPAKKEGAYYALRSSGLMDDFDASVSIRFIEGEREMIRAGFYLRFSDDGGYGFLISVQTTYTFGWFQKDEKGELVWNRLLPWTWHTALRDGFNVNNRLRVICDAESFRVFLNGVLATSFKDAKFRAGRVYLTADPGGNSGGTFAFSDLQLREPPGW